MKPTWLIKRVDSRLARLIEALEQLVKREKRRRVFVRMRKGYERDKKHCRTPPQEHARLLGPHHSR